MEHRYGVPIFCFRDLVREEKLLCSLYCVLQSRCQQNTVRWLVVLIYAWKSAGRIIVGVLEQEKLGFWEIHIDFLGRTVGGRVDSGLWIFRQIGEE